MKLIDCPAANLTEAHLLGYIGGIIDGEGYIGISSANVKGKRGQDAKLYNLAITVSMTTSEAIDALRLVFGGELSFVSRPPHKKIFMWRLRKRVLVREFVDMMLKSNCILVKAKQLKLAQEFLIVTEGRLQSPETREIYYQKFKELNK